MRTSLSPRIPQTLVTPQRARTAYWSCALHPSSPIRYHSSTGNYVQCVLELVLFRPLYFESELDMELDRLEIELTELDYNLL